jgi:hypothetical protein
VSNARLHTVRAAIACCAAAFCVALAGCGSGGKAQVSGTVTVDNEPLANGTIQFYPVDGNGQSAGTGITGGKYEVEASAGKMKVVINGTKVVGKIKQYDTPDSPYVEDIRELLPPKYNTQSELTVELKSGSNPNVNFDLSSKDAKGKK